MEQSHAPANEMAKNLAKNSSNKTTTFDLTKGRDELNLAEFPLFDLRRRIPADVKTLTYETEVTDSVRNRKVTRKMQIVASDEYGLPTVRDADVLFALILILKQTEDFQTPVVAFSRYQLREILGWPDTGKSYKRIDEALCKWVSLTMFFESWWNKGESKFKNLKGFHMLEEVSLNAVAGRTKRGNMPLSSVRFSERIFESFSNGNIKALNLAEYFNLTIPAAKQAYRFLDKRFYHRANLEFDLRTFACEHVGLSKNHPPRKLKEKLKPAIEELERIGFITAVPPEKRYLKTGHGKYKIFFSRSRRQSLGEMPLLGNKQQRSESRSLVKELTDRKVTAAVARKMVEDKNISDDLIREKIELLDWIRRETPEQSPRSPGGWLTKAIKEDYQLPEMFQTNLQFKEKKQAASTLLEKKKKQKDDEKKNRDLEQEKIATENATQWNLVLSFIETLSEEEKETLIQQSIQAYFHIKFRSEARKYHASGGTYQAGKVHYEIALQVFILPLITDHEAA